MAKFQGAIRRVITGDNAQGQSVVIIDGGPSSEKGKSATLTFHGVIASPPRARG